MPEGGPEPGSTALLVVDVQRDFCEGGSLAVTGGASVATRISALLGGPGRARYALVVATRDWHVDPGGHFAPAGIPPDFRDTWPPHCVAGTPGADWHADLRLPAGTMVFSKGRSDAAYSGFEGHDDQGRPLVEVLRRASIRRVEIAGLATSYCVRATALDAASLGFATRVITNLVSDVDGADTARALSEMDAAGVALAPEPGAEP